MAIISTKQGFRHYFWGAVTLICLVQPAQAVCRQALALGLDISGSVDENEYRLQLDGLAGALFNPDVQDAFMAMPDTWVRLLIYEWAGPNSQRILVPWTEISANQQLDFIGTELLSTDRAPHELSTALGQAMLFGGKVLSQQFECWRRTLDLSGDGESNIGPRPRETLAAPILFGVTINGLVIGADAPPFSDASRSEISQLTGYFKSEVIRGPDAFVETAIEFEGFQDAMAKKLLKEIQTRAVGALIDRN